MTGAAMTGDGLAQAALALVGTRFRLHGRDPLSGLDCIGVLAAALAALGQRARLPNGYALRTLGLPDLSGIAAGLGMETAGGPIASGDVLMLRPSPCQLHLAIVASPRSVVHAHAGLRKVVLGPLPAHWPVAAHWRLQPHPVSTRI
ncbi:hypothetical protein [Novosphingobium sp. BL-52-GroH]|uniref:hypothetical protein n=1 Tax=Novosphingobium sp. BL-52-GroH TaxID=3349877 RepID=UPI00384C8378